MSARVPVHGKLHTYSRLGCRCAQCREAVRVYRVARRARLRGPAPEPTPLHGTLIGYVSRRCRCAECREAYRVWRADYRARKRKTGSGIYSRAAESYRPNARQQRKDEAAAS